MNDTMILDDGKWLVISDDLIGLYYTKEAYESGEPNQSMTRYEDSVHTEKKLTYLLFGREVCSALAEGEFYGEVIDLIMDGAEFSVIASDGNDLLAILQELENLGSYAFITDDQYSQLIQI